MLALSHFAVGLMPKFLVRIFTRPYIAGERVDDAVDTADALYAKRRLCATVDLLGEAITERSQVESELQQYRELIRALGGRSYTTASLKLSALGQSIDEDWCYENILELAALAREQRLKLTVDMEDSSTIDSTLRIYRRLRDGQGNGQDNDHVGIVLQSRLNRTRQDIEDLKPLKPRVRICIGIYREPSAIALTAKPEMKQRLLAHAREMWQNGQVVEVATHDEAVIDKALEIIDADGVRREQVEFQMLLGVPREKRQRALVEAGYTVRLYVPYGQHWYPYCTRRLADNPELAKHVLVNMITGGKR